MAMRTLSPVRSSLFVLAACIALATLASPAARAEADAGASALPACIAVGVEARYVPYGYNHIVSLRNGCSRAAACTVATDVNPQPTSATVAAGSTVDVLTFSGSPAKTFTPRVSCGLQ